MSAPDLFTNPREFLLPAGIPPVWLWVIIAIIAACAHRYAIPMLPREVWYTKEDMQELLSDLMDAGLEKGEIISEPKVCIYDDKQDIYMIREVIDQDGEKWSVFSPLNRGAWRVFQIWWLTVVGIHFSCWFVAIVIMVRHAFAFCKNN